MLWVNGHVNKSMCSGYEHNASSTSYIVCQFTKMHIAQIEH